MGDVLIKGVVASLGSGSVSGRVTVVTKPKDIEKLRKRDIVVSSDIGSAKAHFDQKYHENLHHVASAIFENASALIMEKGSVAYPICISAREKHLLVVVKAKSATKKLKDGIFVEVDVRTGEIKRIS